MPILPLANSHPLTLVLHVQFWPTLVFSKTPAMHPFPVTLPAIVVPSLMTRGASLDGYVATDSGASE